MNAFEFVCNLTGFLLTIYGTSVTYRAMATDYGEFSNGGSPLKTPGRVRAWLRTRWRRVSRRTPQGQVIYASASDSATMTGSAHIAMSGPSIPDSATTEEKVRLLVQRVAQIEQQARHDRDWHIEQLHQKSVQDDLRSQRSTEAIDNLEGSLKKVAIGTIRRQVQGLIWVATGTLLTATADVLPPVVDFIERLVNQ